MNADYAGRVLHLKVYNGGVTKFSDATQNPIISHVYALVLSLNMGTYICGSLRSVKVSANKFQSLMTTSGS